MTGWWGRERRSRMVHGLGSGIFGMQVLGLRVWRWVELSTACFGSKTKVYPGLKRAIKAYIKALVENGWQERLWDLVLIGGYICI